MITPTVVQLPPSDASGVPGLCTCSQDQLAKASSAQRGRKTSFTSAPQASTCLHPNPGRADDRGTRGVQPPQEQAVLMDGQRGKSPDAEVRAAANPEVGAVDMGMIPTAWSRPARS